MKKIVILGAGRLGCSLGLALKASGYRLAAITCAHKSSAQQSCRILDLPSLYLQPEEAVPQGNFIFICVPDSQIRPLVKKLSRVDLDWSGRFIYQTSGLLDSSVLRPLKKLGARVASFHPVQSFSRKKTPPAHWKNIFITLEGDEEAIAAAREIIQRIGARPIRLDSINKALYHTACSLASNSLVSLISLALDLLERAGLEKSLALEALKPLIDGTWKNLKRSGPAEALTGPIVRGDLMTVREHLKALKAFPLAREIYQRLGLLALELAEKRGLRPSQVKTLRMWLQDK
jgi:predicted short-subunit dehydrogenase-like oxidoreductase (DUF2520 family)